MAQATVIENPGVLQPLLTALVPGAGLMRAETHVLDGIERLGVRNRPVIGHSAATAWDDAVADRIVAHNPLARPTGYVCAAPECGGNAPLFCAALHRPHTLLIVTTAERHGESAINRLALGAGVPAIYGSVLGPAAHGRVFRVIPGVTPCLQCVALSQSRDPARSPRFDPRTAGAEPALPGDRYRQPALPGVSVDVGSVALRVARMALATLGRTHPTIEYPDPGHHHVLCTQHGGWIFGDDAARPLDLPRAIDCPPCGR